MTDVPEFTPTPLAASHLLLNQLLDGLPPADINRWLPILEPVDLPLGQVLCEAGRPPAHVYFPTTAIVSLVYLTQEGESTEVAVVGKDGVVGISVFMGGNSMPAEAVVQSAGQAYRLRAQAIKDEMAQPGPIFMMLLRYTQALMDQVAQTAACNRYHSIDQLMCRRLLLGLERLPGAAMAMTQELLANLLGVRREGVTAAALKLQQAGAIRYSRGHIDVLDRHVLQQRTINSAALALTA
jgi:CRP-like cAMP-binding protein